ncbi:Cdc6/Cdc18 family protein [Halorhabdus salina]|uniref:Cdc6/Cdc18 family protein n=1 Tax=Halorhabdus salina TaxID=2750670 RepID=UPI0015EF98F5|nr:AAA family ATPase [Halorhabdus salina]
MTVIHDVTPLQQNHLPEETVDRERESRLLTENLESRNLHIHGPRGTGKTHLVKKALEEVEARTCYVSCLKHDTQYKALKRIVSQLTREEVESGHHTSELQRRVEEQLEVMDAVIVLDELDFLLLNNEEDLLYFLSRLENGPQITVITANVEKLGERLEPRTYSSLQPRRIQFEPYTGEQVYKILAKRAKKSLAERSVHRNAVTYIASKTQNTELALTWLRVAARNAEETVTEELVEEVEEEAFEVYTECELEHLSRHHKYLYQAVEELSREKGPVINAGDIYQRYRSVAEERGEETLSDRRISDFLKQLEQLNLVKAEYHYGGRKGKTREVSIESP